MKRNATAVWQGSGKEGKGQLNTQSGVLDRTQYSYNTRFEDGIGTNPEELIAAAHAGCFTMKLAFVLGGMGHEPSDLETRCEITFENGAITKSHLIVKGTIPGISRADFEAAVADAEANCPVSQVLKAEISSEATLVD